VDRSSQNFTRYRSIIYAVNAHIQVAIFHSVSEFESDKSGEFAIFTKLVATAKVPSLDISEKRGPDRSPAPKMLLFGEKIAKIGPEDLEIIVLREIIKKKR